MLTFQYEGVVYNAPLAGENDNCFVLPDGRLIEATSWSVDGVTPLTFVGIPYNFVYSDIRELANHFEAVLVCYTE